MPAASWILVIAVPLVLLFAFSNGFNDSSSTVASMIASNALRPRRALALSAVLHFLGPLVGGTLVAHTIGEIVQVHGFDAAVVVVCGVAVALLWNVTSQHLGLPSSSGQALVGGLAGAAVAAGGFSGTVDWGLRSAVGLRVEGVSGAVAALLLSPFVGFLAAFLVFRLVNLVLRGAPISVNRVLRRGQILTSGCLAVAHGTNDAQKSMGAIAILLLAEGPNRGFSVPFWVMIACSAALSLGTLFGGWRIMGTLVRGIYRIGPIHGFSSQSGSTAVVVLATLLGGPVSTAQVVATSIMGVGSAERIRAVRWRMAGNILFSFLVTMPGCALLAAALYYPMRALLGGFG